MQTQSGLHYGFVPSWIYDLLTEAYRQLPPFRSAMVLCIDSIHEPPGVLTALIEYGIEAQLHPSGALLAPERLHLAAQKKFFSGFDEVWLFEHDRPETQISPQIYLTSDGINVLEALPSGLERCMKETRCVLALGDGCGLNYVTRNSVFAAFIEQRYPPEQPRKST